MAIKHTGEKLFLLLLLLMAILPLSHQSDANSDKMTTDVWLSTKTIFITQHFVYETS